MQILKTGDTLIRYTISGETTLKGLVLNGISHEEKEENFDIFLVIHKGKFWWMCKDLIQRSKEFPDLKSAQEHIKQVDTKHDIFDGD